MNARHGQLFSAQHSADTPTCRVGMRSREDTAPSLWTPPKAQDVLNGRARCPDLAYPYPEWQTSKRGQELPFKVGPDLFEETGAPFQKETREDS